MDKVDMDKTVAFGGNSGRWQKVCNAHENCKENLAPQNPSHLPLRAANEHRHPARVSRRTGPSREPGTEAAAAAGPAHQREPDTSANASQLHTSLQ